MKLTKAVNPLTGASADILKPETWISYVLGAFLFLATFWGAEFVMREIKGTTGVNVQPSDPFAAPVPQHHAAVHHGPTIL